jgi:hypothetical protein
MSINIANIVDALEHARDALKTSQNQIEAALNLLKAPTPATSKASVVAESSDDLLKYGYDIFSNTDKRTAALFHAIEAEGKGDVAKGRYRVHQMLCDQLAYWERVGAEKMYPFIQRNIGETQCDIISVVTYRIRDFPAPIHKLDDTAHIQLRKYGYSMADPSVKRQAALSRALTEYSPREICHRLTALNELWAKNAKNNVTNAELYANVTREDVQFINRFVI